MKRIENILITEEQRTRLSPVVYTNFVVKKHFEVILKLLLWIMKKLKVKVQENYVSYKQVTVNEENLIRRLRLDLEAAHFLNNKDPRYLILGPRQLENLLDDKVVMTEFISFDVQYQTGYKFMDLEIICLPWLDGMFLRQTLLQRSKS